MKTIEVTPDLKSELEQIFSKAFSFATEAIKEMIKAGLAEEKYIFRLQKRIVCAYHISPADAFTILEGAVDYVNQTRV